MIKENQFFIWEEKNLTEQKKNLLTKEKLDNESSIQSTENDYPRKNLTDTTKTVNGCIYKIINKINGNYYVGSTKNINKRIRDHKRELSYNRHHCRGLQRAWNKYGNVNFEFVIIETLVNSDLFTIEQKYLDKSKTEKTHCYNSSMTAGGGIIWLNGINPRTGTTHTEETKKKMREAAKGRVLSDETKEKLRNFMLSINNSNRGKRRSEETKNNISKALTGRKLSAEHRLKASVSNKGKKHTDEWKRQSKLRNRGVNNPSYDCNIYNLQNIFTNELFVGTRHQFKEKINLSSNSQKVNPLFNGGIKKYSGWIILKNEKTGEEPLTSPVTI